MEALLRFDNVSKQYPNGVHALNGVSFTVGEGEFISVIGPSGSGKSTLLRAINRLISISGGTVLLEGEAVSRQRGRALRALRRKVGMIFQNYNLVYSLSVLQNVLHGRLGYMRGLKGIFGLYSEADKRQALELLEELGLGEFSYNRASDLSGGQKQLVGIARAIMQGPKLLLCDEPIASLDPSSSKTIMDLLRSMTQKRNIACIVNLHQLDVALQYSTRIIGLSKGEIVFDGPPQQLDDETIQRIYGTSRENLMLGTNFNPMTLIANGDAFVEFITQDFLPPALPKASRIPGVLESVVVTLALALSSTTVAAILAFFVALFGSEKVSPFPKAAKFVRGFATFLRNIPALVWAFILFSSLGIGTGVGFVALCITSFAFLVRAFVETMEDVSQDCVESLQAVGASFPQRVSQAILPSCLSGFLSWFLYSVEVNIRASTIVGMVGGGGVGLTLFSYIKSFQYDIALSIILLVAVMVIVVDQITGKLRKELLK